jgi:WS/DGAT/MGAT family acyltransferase
MAMERLNPEDRIMLWPDQLWPQEIGALAILDGSKLRIDAVVPGIEARLHLVPRLRQLLFTPRRGLGGPLWLDAPHFDIREHIGVTALPAPATEASLLMEVERLRRQRLDRSRPLWQMRLFTGLPGNRVALFVKMHHAIADGIAGIASVSALLDIVPDAVPDSPARTAAPWKPAPPPSARELFLDNLRRRTRRVGHALSTLAHPAATARRVRYGWAEMRKLSGTRPEITTSLDRVVGPGRRLALVRGRLDEVKRVAHAHDATVNDVFLTIVTAGVRALLTARGEPVDEAIVRIDVPVTLRRPQDRKGARGNLVSQMFVPAPIAISDPLLRLKHIAAETAVAKTEARPSAGALLSNRFVRRAVLKLLRRRPVNVTTADLPGPAQPLYLAGAPVLEVFPLLPLMGNVTLGIGALSYAGQFTMTVIADADTYPDVDVFTEALAEELAVLTGLPA